MNNMETSDSIPSYFRCPACFHLPEDKVFQCREGHVICEKCYVKLKECPQCRTPYDPVNPIRARSWEAMLDEALNVNCAFKINGCKRKIRRDQADNHQAGCVFDFEKFGNLANVCKLLGYSNCDFQVNKGNAKDALEHFTSKHGSILTKKKKLTMELKEFEDVKASSKDETTFWTSIVQDLEEEKCYLLTMAGLINKEDTVTCFTLILPYLPTQNETEIRDKASFMMEYTVTNEMDSQQDLSWGWGLLQLPITLEKAEQLLPRNIPCSFRSSKLGSHLSNTGSLLITVECVLNGVKAPIKNSKGGKIRLNRFQCVKSVTIENPSPALNANIPKTWNFEDGGWIVKNVFNQQKLECIRNGTIQLLDKLFGRNQLQGISVEDLEWLRRGSMFIAAEFGSMIALQYLMELLKTKEFPYLHLNLTDGIGETPLFYAFRDKDKVRGLRKAKFLVENGASVKILNFRKSSLLHVVAQHGSLSALDYLLEKGLELNEMNMHGHCPLHSTLLTIEGDTDRASGLEKAKFLVIMGADFMHFGYKGRCILHYAVVYSVEATKYFLGLGLNINAPDEDGSTPLHCAVTNEIEEMAVKIVEILLAKKADKTIKDKQGRSPLDVADKEHKMILEMLR